MIYSRAKRIEIISWLKEVLHTPIEGKILSTSTDELKLSTRATNALNKTGIKTISDFMLFCPEKLCGVRNVGKKTIHEIGNAIKKVWSKDMDRKKGRNVYQPLNRQ